MCVEMMYMCVEIAYMCACRVDVHVGTDGVQVC